MSGKGFDVAGSAYDRFIGRYSRELAPRFLAFSGLTDGPVLDVGCGPGALTAALAARFGAERVAAIDPSEPFVAACRARVPGADVRAATAEALPFADGAFQGALSQLVLSFVRDADGAARELTRVVRPGGIVAACTFDARGFDLVRIFWEAALRFDPAAPDDANIPYRREEELVALWRRAEVRDIVSDVVDLRAGYSDFDDLWAPFAFGIGPAGGYLAARPEERRAAIRDAYFDALGSPSGGFELGARAIAVRGRVRDAGG